tara:strand:+ start:3607 stop:4407 length:801 start_codon:yes stop_codon:yes gene_type:complete
MLPSFLASEEIKLLTYNTHGLPAIFSGDDPDKRFPLIAKQINRYQISLLQEDFAHHEVLLNGLEDGAIAIRGNKNQSNFCLFCSGSGLTTISNLGKDWELKFYNEAFNTCSGWLGKLNDCFASKGFQLISVKSPAGKEFFIINTHLDAGRDNSDRKARESQLNQILTKVKQELSGEALILAGDLNLNWNDDQDRLLLENFKSNLGLLDPINGVQVESGWSIIDYILYRNSEKTSFDVIKKGQDIKFLTEKGPLSDHPALYLKLKIN